MKDGSAFTEFSAVSLTITLAVLVMSDPCVIRQAPVLMALAGLYTIGIGYMCKSPAMWFAIAVAWVGTWYHARGCRETFTKNAPEPSVPSNFLPGPTHAIGFDVIEEPGTDERRALVSEELLHSAQSNTVPTMQTK